MSPVPGLKVRVPAEKSAEHFFTCNVQKTRKGNCRHNNRGKEPDLGALLVYVFEDCLICRVVEPSLDPPFFIILESGAEPLRAVVEGVSERFMDTIKCFLARQESLVLELESKTRNTKHLRSSLTLSKAVEQARGCVATKMGVVDILVGSRASAQTMLQVDAGSQPIVKVSTAQVITLSQAILSMQRSKRSPEEPSRAADKRPYVAEPNPRRQPGPLPGNGFSASE
jgi:hypothetical protein